MVTSVTFRPVVMIFRFRCALLCLLLALIGGLFWMASERQPSLVLASGRSFREEIESRREIGASRVPTAMESQRISAPGWEPPRVFHPPGRAVVADSPARGQNSRRQFAEPVTRELVAALDHSKPAILAQLPADRRTHLEAAEIDQFTLLGRRLAFNRAAVESVLAGETRRLLAPSVDQEVVELVIDSVTSREALTHTLSGKVAGEEETSVVQLVLHDGILHGSVVRYESGRELEYRILRDGYLMVRELDQVAMSDSCGVIRASEEVFPGGEAGGSQALAPEADTGAADAAGLRTVDMVVGYGRDARVADGGVSQIEARIISSIDRMNRAFANSGIANAEVVLLGTIEDPDYDFPGARSSDMDEELYQLEIDDDGILDAVSDYRETLGADLMSFVVSGVDGSAGLAHEPGRSSVVTRSYMTATRISFAHEVAHNLGCDHSWGDSSQDYKTGYGWRLDPPSTVRVRTIMAYDWNWGNGLRIAYFANPEVSYNGARTGATPGYDVRGDATADQRYAVGGIGFSGSNRNLAGFDGSQAALGAMNADTIDTGGGFETHGIGPASNRATRTDLMVLNPAGGSKLEPGSVCEIFFVGGELDDRATLQLLRGGQVVATLAGSLNPATQRLFAWTIDRGLGGGADYQVRVVLNRDGSQVMADSGVFEIYGDSPRVISQSPTQATTNEAVSEVKLTFNRSMDPASFSVLHDVVSFTGPGGADLQASLIGGSWSDSNRVLTISFREQSDPGTYRLVLAPSLLDPAGLALDQDGDLAVGEETEDRYVAQLQVLGLGTAVDTTRIVWTTGGDAAWFPQQVVTHDGVDAAESGNVVDGGVSSLETTVVGPGTLTFWWKVDSEAYYDRLEFYLNGVLQTGDLAPISGSVDWQQRSLVIPEGEQALRWVYRKDESVSEGADTGWLDEVVYTPETGVEDRPYERWGAGAFAGAFVARSPMANPDGDLFLNLQEFAFGMDPTDSRGTSLVYAVGEGLISAGPPVIEDSSGDGVGSDFSVVFPRRKDFLEAGLIYRVQFSADLRQWSNASVEPVLRTGALAQGDLEVVAVPFPAEVALAAGGSMAPLFYRVGVTMATD